jgi:tRNA 2-thiouridine synthesizing protein E
MKKLFPSGYLRGACRLAGITYANRRVNYYGEAMIPRQKTAKNGSFPLKKNKIYSTDIHGFLIDHRQWDEDFAAHRMADMKVTGGITKKHWEIIHYLRNTFEKKNIVPTFFTCCEENDISIEALENLFPIGYHRGAIKAAGLRVRNMELN